jgi:hypothetical protein
LNFSVNCDLPFEDIPEICDVVALHNGFSSNCFATYTPKTELAISVAAGSSNDFPGV